MGLIVKSLLVVATVFLVSCNTNNQSVVEDKLNDISDNQKVLIRKIANMETSIANMAFSNKNQQANKKEPPKADPNKVYNIPIGDSFSKGPDDAAVTIIEWSDFQ